MPEMVHYQCKPRSGSATPSVYRGKKSEIIFSSPVRMYRKSYCTSLGVSISVWVAWASLTLKFLCDGQDAVRQAILYVDRSCLRIL